MTRAVFSWPPGSVGTWGCPIPGLPGAFPEGLCQLRRFCFLFHSSRPGLACSRLSAECQGERVVLSDKKRKRKTFLVRSQGLSKLSALGELPQQPAFLWSSRAESLEPPLDERNGRENLPRLPSRAEGCSGVSCEGGAPPFSLPACTWVLLGHRTGNGVPVLAKSGAPTDMHPAEVCI